MSFLRTLFGLQPAKAPSTRSQSSPASQSVGSAAPPSNRRELLRVAIRSTLNRHGIPISWLGAEVLAAKPRGGEPSLHLRLLIRHWDPRLMAHAVALQNSLIDRVMTFDPLAANWLTGISWQFDLPDEGLCPAMPPPGSWTGEMPGSKHAAVRPHTPSAAGSAIEPAAAADYPADVKEDLQRLLAIRDAELQRSGERAATDGKDPAQPTYSQTQPMPLQ